MFLLPLLPKYFMQKIVHNNTELNIVGRICINPRFMVSFDLDTSYGPDTYLDFS